MSSSDPTDVPQSGRWVALVDCESFYASCEAVFDPTLRGQPIVVLSNNDGCVIALNRLAKARGAKMGTPWFEAKAWCEVAGIHARSSNYELYGSLSARVMQIIAQFSAWQEVYSIDESFIGLHGSVAEAIALGREIRQRVMAYTGIPVRVGIGQTKTQAKLAILGAKADANLGGVCHLASYGPAQQDRIFDSIPVSELWGVGRRLTKRLAALGIHTARDLRDANVPAMRKKFSVNVARTILELRGVKCIELEPVSPRDHKDQLIFSRSFAMPVRTEREMRQVLSMYAQKVSGRLRQQGLVAGVVSSWASTAYYREGYQSAHASVAVPTPTDDPIVLGRAAHYLLPRMQAGAGYVRAGVVLTGLVAKSSEAPLPLFEPEFEGRGIGGTLDSITAKLGAGCIGVGYGGLRDAPAWNMKRGLLSKRAMTEWAELPVVRA